MKLRLAREIRKKPLVVAGVVLASVLLAGLISPVVAQASARAVKTVVVGPSSFTIVQELATDATTNTVYVDRGDSISAINTATDKVIDRIPVKCSDPQSGSGTMSFMPGAGTLYMVCGNGISAINTATDKVIDRIPLSLTPFSLAVDPATDMIYSVASYNNSSGIFPNVYNLPTGTFLFAVNGATDKVVRRIRVSSGSLSLAVDPATDMIYVSANTSVLVINGATDKVVRRIPLSLTPFSLAVDAATDMIYVSANKSVRVINGRTDKVSRRVDLEYFAGNVSVDPATDMIYVSANKSVLVINGATDKVTDSIQYSPVDVRKDIIKVMTVGLAIDPATEKIYVGYGTLLSVVSARAPNNTDDSVFITFGLLVVGFLVVGSGLAFAILRRGTITSRGTQSAAPGQGA